MIKIGLFIALFLASSILLKAEPVTIRVLNGKNGKPMPNVRVLLQDATTNYTLGDAAETDSNGRVTFSLGQSTSIRPAVDGVGECANKREAIDPSFSVAKIRDAGLVESNQCGKFTIPPRPGELVLFCRPPTWWEKHLY
jgi:hypothetical protein